MGQPATTTNLAADYSGATDPQFTAYLNLKLREIGQPGLSAQPDASGLAPLVDHFLALSREKDRALARHLCPVDQRIQNFLYDHLDASGEADDVPRLPETTLVLDRPGLARVLSLPPAEIGRAHV